MLLRACPERLFTLLPQGTVLNAGSAQVLHVDFTPTDTTNYDGLVQGRLHNVLKATLNYSASGTSQYSDPLSSFTISFSGFVNGDGAGVVSGTPSCSTTATSTSAPGQLCDLMHKWLSNGREL